MARKQRRTPVYYSVITFRDGAAGTCRAVRKPSARRIKEDRIQIDPDNVCQEFLFDLDEIKTWSERQVIRSSDLLTNRLNTRRAIRELVLPELEAIQKSLEILHQQVKNLRDGFEIRLKNANIPNRPT